MCATQRRPFFCSQLCSVLSSLVRIAVTDTETQRNLQNQAAHTGRCCGAAFVPPHFSRKKRQPFRQPRCSLEHKQGCFFQTSSLAASSAPQSLCDSHDSEVLQPTSTSKSPKKTAQPSLLQSPVILINMNEGINEY